MCPADAAIREIARVAEEVNTNVDNIGARRLHTILERILEDVSFDAPEKVRCGLWGGRLVLCTAVGRWQCSQLPAVR
jgi:hypothetical protein